MKKEYSSHRLHVNDIDIHYCHYQNENPKMLLMPGLTDNTPDFAGLVGYVLTLNFVLSCVG